MNGRVICFGELLLRFTAPGYERLMQSPRFDVHFGGAEANVAVSLARFGHDVSMVSAVPENPFGDSILAALVAQGVDTTGVARHTGRMGLYFLETGAVRRPSRIVYDRADSVFAKLPDNAYDWPHLLEGAGWLHVSGITPAVSLSCANAVRNAVGAARELGVKVAFDGNYREALWRQWGGDGPAVLRDILAGTDLAFINERDIALVLGTPVEPRTDAIARAFDTFPGLGAIAATHRQQASVANQTLTGEYYTRDARVISRPHDLVNVVDRIGGGDAFAAGVLHGAISAFDADHLIEFATAASAIKHSIPGDWNLTNLAEVEEAIRESGLDVQR